MFVCAVAFISFIIESTIFRFLEIRHVQPNLAIAVTVAYAILRGSIGGAVMGMLTGLLQDVFFGSSIGYYALIYMTTGYICGMPGDTFFKDNFFLPLIFCFLSTLLNGLFIYVTGFLIYGKFDFGFFFANIILPETVYTLVFSFFIYRLLFGANKKLEEYEFKKRKVF